MPSPGAWGRRIRFWSKLTPPITGSSASSTAASRSARMTIFLPAARQAAAVIPTLLSSMQPIMQPISNVSAKAAIFAALRSAAGFHQLDIDQVAGSHRQEAKHFIRSECGFVGHDIGFDMFGHIFETFEIVCFNRLFDQLDVQTFGFEAANRPDRIFWPPALIGVQPDLDGRSDGGADGLYPPDIQGGVIADLDFNRGISVSDGFQRITHPFHQARSG